MPLEVLIPLNALPVALMRWLAINAPELVGRDCEWSLDRHRGGVLVREYVPAKVAPVAVETRRGMVP